MIILQYTHTHTRISKQLYAYTRRNSPLTLCDISPILRFVQTDVNVVGSIANICP